jgi:archaemetzincin
MKVGILKVGQVVPEIVALLEHSLPKTFPDTTCSIIKEVLPIPQSAFDKKRNQYNSSIILNAVRVFEADTQEFHRVLGVVDVDIFTSGLNYVFGEAYTPGGSALISLWRLKPEFYKDKADNALYISRALKEAVHELGHTLDVKHCQRSFCVMHFSNSIFDTDKKQNLLCDECYLQAAIAISNLG